MRTIIKYPEEGKNHQNLISGADPALADMRLSSVLMRIRAFEKLHKVKVSNIFISKRPLPP